MKAILTLTLSLFLVFSITEFTNAQDVKDVDVKTLSSSDFQKAQQAMKDAGLSEEEAIRLARQRGATQQQIDEYRSRISQQDTTGMQNMLTDSTALFNEEQNNVNTVRTAEFEPTRRIFGSYLFNSENLTFEPRINIQTPKNYEIGIDDQLLIHIWGNSQNDYQLTVNNNGQILIPDVGPVYVAGLTFDEAEKKIKSRLSEIYADMGGPNPGTFAQVNMGQLRSIQITLVGEAVTPGTYTLPATATVFNVLYLSGGPNEIGSFRNIQLIRDKKLEKTVDIYHFLVDGDTEENAVLHDGDILFIPPLETRVKTGGQFKRDGLFEMKESEMLSDLIRFAGGFSEDAFVANTKIYRKSQQGQQIVDVRYSDLAITPLINGDSICNDSIPQLFENRVFITGSVYQPGEYEWFPGLTLSQLIVKADSLTPDAFQARGLITRQNSDWSYSSINFNVKDVISGKSDILLHKEDSVIIKSHFDLKERQFIQVNGEVLNPGEFSWADNLTLGDAIYLAGGFTEGADSTFIEVSRRLSYQEASTLSDTIGHIIIVNMSRGLNIGENDANMKLQPYDQVSVRRAPNFRQSKTAFITGEVVYEGAYSITFKKLRISDLIEMAGGITPQAYISGATLQRTSVELGTESVAIDLTTILKNPHTEADLFLNDGDLLNIPEYMQTVKITGNVQNPFSVVFESGKNAKFYIDQAGGFADRSDKKRTYVRYPNGSTAVTKGFIFKRYPEVTAGSQVVVPQRPERDASEAQRWVSIASVLASLSLSIATIVNLTK